MGSFPNDPEITAAFIAAVVAFVTTIVATPLKYVIDRRALRYRLGTEYEYQQRKELRQLIGRYRGQMLQAADLLSRRLGNLYTNEEQRWLRTGGNYLQVKGYYFISSVYRYLSVCTLADQFEKECLFIDSRIAEKKDLDFVKLIRAILRASTDAGLFRNLAYDDYESVDHVFSDDLRMASDKFWPDKRLLAIDEFKKLVGHEDAFLPILRLFDDLRANEQRYRWDRMVVIHLLLIAFMNTFGYDFQKTNDESLQEVVSKIRHPWVLENLCRWLPELGLDRQSEIERIRRVAMQFPVHSTDTQVASAQSSI